LIILLLLAAQAVEAVSARAAVLAGLEQARLYLLLPGQLTLLLLGLEEPPVVILSMAA
jgi:hypothetical protein